MLLTCLLLTRQHCTAESSCSSGTYTMECIGFQAQTTYEVGSAPRALAVSDFTRDGRIDIVTANHVNGTVSVLLGNGDGSFQARTTFDVGIPQGVAVGDFNGDGRLNIVAANWGNNTVSILIGNGDGTFEVQAVFTVGASPISVAVGDIKRGW